MGKRFNEIRVFCGNEYVGHNFHYIEFVIDNKNSFQEIITRLSEGSRIHLSRSKTGEYVFDPYQESKYFIKALRNTDFSKTCGATRYDEACLLAQDYTNRRSGVNYYRDDENLMPIDELLDIAGELYFGENKDKIDGFKQECLDVLKINKGLLKMVLKESNNLLFFIIKFYNAITDVNRFNSTNRLAVAIYLCRFNFAVGFYVGNWGCAEC